MEDRQKEIEDLKTKLAEQTKEYEELKQDHAICIKRIDREYYRGWDLAHNACRMENARLKAELKAELQAKDAEIERLKEKYEESESRAVIHVKARDILKKQTYEKDTELANLTASLAECREALKASAHLKKMTLIELVHLYKENKTEFDDRAKKLDVFLTLRDKALTNATVQTAGGKVRRLVAALRKEYTCQNCGNSKHLSLSAEDEEALKPFEGGL